MALGFGFNKAKVLSSAEKYVQQGKLQNAISEYEKVIKEDPRDLTVLNTIGDLYARLGQTDRATAYFKKVGDAYAGDGFTVKAIAMYKKLTKLSPNAVDAVQKLAELYTQQGLYNDARQQYVQIADYWMKANDLAAAAGIFQKMLELDPENAAMQTKLADLYIRMGKKDDAKEIFFRAADSLHMRAALDGAAEALGKILTIDPANPRALLKCAQIAFDQGDIATAIRHLEKISDLESNPDGLALMLRARLQAGQADQCEKIARTLVASHKDLSGIEVLAQWRVAGGSVEKGLQLYREFSGQLGKEGMARALEPVLAKVKDNIPALETVRELYEITADRTHIVESTELLAHALVQKGELKRARDLYAELVKIEPENPQHEQLYRQVIVKLGEDAAVRPLSPQEAAQAFMVDEIEISAPAVVQEYEPDLEEAIKAALTDSELLDSYNLPAKALAPLEKILPKAPNDVRLNQRLASLYAGANRFGEAARCCDVLQQQYRASGHEEEARQYADMATKYRERGEAAPAAPPPAAAEIAASAAAVPASALEVTPPPSEEEAGAPHEIDLSEEWETHAIEPGAPSAGVEAPAGPGATAADIAEEAKFYLSQSMWNEARAACSRLQALAPDHPELSSLVALLPAAVPAAAPAIPVEPPAAAAPVIPLPIPVSPPAAPKPAAAAAAASAGALGEFVSDLEASLGTDFSLGAPAEALPPTPAPPPVRPAPPKPTEPVAAAPAPSAPPAGPVSDESSLLSEMFAEFKEDAEQGTDQAEDPETHYNLGVAFREMGLLDEAIGELQKVCQAIDKGMAFRDAMQAYTWLAQCFVEKGVPEAGVKWYERALKMSSDEEQRLALHYDLASAFEAGGNKQAALQHFMEVYGSNIDYRDVADRIKALRS